MGLYGAPGRVRLGLVSLAIFFKNLHGYIYKTSIFSESDMDAISSRLSVKREFQWKSKALPSISAKYPRFAETS